METSALEKNKIFSLFWRQNNEKTKNKAARRKNGVYEF